MKSFTAAVSFTLFVFVLLVMTTQAFMTPSSLSSGRRHFTISLHMADEPLSTDRLLGPTERLLLERKRARDLGLVQELGRTIKKDGLDSVRAAVWALYGVSNVVFPVLAVGLLAGLGLNLVGYGYFWNEHNQLVVDTLEHIRQENYFQQELLNIASQKTNGFL